MNTDSKYTRPELLEALKNNKVVVTFTKVDGTVRDLFCTLKADLIPSEKTEKKDKKKTAKKKNDSVICAFDLGTAKAWRSFRVESVTGMIVIKE